MTAPDIDAIATALAAHGIALPQADLAFLAAQAAMLARTLQAVHAAAPKSSAA